LEHNSEPRDDLIAKGYELINGEYVRKNTTLSPWEIENQAERDAVRFFKE
jgi:hypothetical protein